ncbi:MAG: PLP-dependent aminotransferase family protein [Chloroflexota bacterium]
MIAHPPLKQSARMAYLERSVMRDLLKHAVDPSIISLAGGLPANEDLPTEQLQACMQHVIQRDGGSAFQYSPQNDNLRDWIVNYMRGRGVDCTADNIFITNGNQQGLTILANLLLDVGSVAVTESVIFTGIQQATKGMGAQVITVPTHMDSGVDVDALEDVFAHEDVRMAVLVPDFHNPLGISIPEENRQRIAALARRYRVPIIEDDPYSQTRFIGKILAPIAAYDTSGLVFYMGSFSKMLAPGLRLGWMVVPDDLLPQVTVLRESIDLESSTLMQRVVAEFLQRGYLDARLAKLRDSLRLRANALMNALDTHLGDIATWTVPEGGLFSWCTLPQEVNTWDVFDTALESGVVFVPGGAFAVDGGYENTMRLNFSNVAPADFDPAIERLSQAIRQHI